jgi:hypothetical protein
MEAGFLIIDTNTTWTNYYKGYHVKIYYAEDDFFFYVSSGSFSKKDISVLFNTPIFEYSVQEFPKIVSRVEKFINKRFDRVQYCKKLILGEWEKDGVLSEFYFYGVLKDEYRRT